MLRSHSLRWTSEHVTTHHAFRCTDIGTDVDLYYCTTSCKQKNHTEPWAYFIALITIMLPLPLRNLSSGLRFLCIKEGSHWLFLAGNMICDTSPRKLVRERKVSSHLVVNVNIILASMCYIFHQVVSSQHMDFTWKTSYFYMNDYATR